MPLHDPKHPIWGWSKTIVGILALTAVLAFNANDFDATELKAIGQWALIAFGVQGAHSMWKVKVENADSSGSNS